MIDIQKLSKTYGNTQVLDIINIQFLKEKIYGIVGENGAGKTTLFKCIAGLESYKGSIISTIHPIKNQLGFLVTDPFFFTKITGREYIKLLTQSRGITVTDIDAKNIFDLPLDRYASMYSTGMKKKLALMAILLQDNEIFILDEPFNGVDIQGNLMITEIIKKLHSLGKTIIISSHIFSTLSNTCDEIFVLHKGRIKKRVTKEAFAELEKEMHENTIGNRIKDLGLN